MTLQEIMLTISALLTVVIYIILLNRERKSRAKIDKNRDDFINIIVHTLRTPATAIKDASALLLDQSQNFSQDEIKKFILLINTQTKSLLDQIRSILDAAKIETGIFVVQKNPDDITKVINESFETFLPEAKEHSITLRKEIPEALPKLDIDTTRIKEVIDNLFSNSLKFTPKGGTITITAKSIQYRSKDNKNHNKNSSQEYIEVCISDTGIGIPKNQQEKLFSKFSNINHPSVSSNIAHSKDDTGLGLYIAKGIIDAHSGIIKVSSESGKGTSISFLLPL